MNVTRCSIFHLIAGADGEERQDYEAVQGKLKISLPFPNATISPRLLRRPKQDEVGGLPMGVGQMVCSALLTPPSHIHRYSQDSLRHRHRRRRDMCLALGDMNMWCLASRATFVSMKNSTRTDCRHFFIEGSSGRWRHN